jgi:hypothetical protein
LTQDHGVGEALERRRPISWTVVNVRPRPSISPWPWHHGRRGDVLGRGHTSITAWAISLFWGLACIA